MLRYHVKHGMCLIMGGHISASLGMTHLSTRDLIGRGQPLMGVLIACCFYRFGNDVNQCEISRENWLEPESRIRVKYS